MDGKTKTPADVAGESRWQRHLGLKVHPVVFPVSALFIFGAVVLGVVFQAQTEGFFNKVQGTIATSTGWFFILSVNVFVIFSFYLMFSRFGAIRLGGPKAHPDFSLWGWFAVLFSAGMGIGLVFWSVAEPIFHFSAPPYGEALTNESARRAMTYTFYHWGVHAWAIYAIVGLALAYFSFNKGLPLTIRSIFYPLLGNKVNGLIGDLIDILAVVATLFGVATSLGLGVMQISAGLTHVFPGMSGVPFLEVILIGIITAIATLSVVLGLDAGIKRLSEINMWAAATLMIFVLIAGPTIFLLNSFVQNLGTYIQNLPAMSTYTEALRQTEWVNGWTVFYWSWWIAWSPFVGMFIARISRGRTIREFLLGVLFVPTLLTFFWLTVFGNSALHEELFGAGGIVAAVNENLDVALFVLLERYPASFFMSLLSIFVIVAFFVTSSDSGSLVIDMITAGGNTDPPVKQRIFWAVLEGVVAATLLAGGGAAGLKGLQTATITTGLPFTIVLVLVCYSLYRALAQEMPAHKSLPNPQAPAPTPKEEREREKVIAART